MKTKERRKLLLELGFHPDDLNDWINKWMNLKGNSKTKGRLCSLTFRDYVYLAHTAGITIAQIGQRSEQFCLGRMGDTGDYTIDNCRFITQAQNQVERRNNGGLKSASDKIRGRSKETHQSIARQSQKISKRFEVTSPEGIIYSGQNLKAFCLKMELNYRGLSAICRGTIKSSIGWRGRYI